MRGTERATGRRRRRRAASLLGLTLGLAAAFATRAARAADWPLIGGTEEGQPKSPLPGGVRPFGFVQVTTEGMLGGEVNGLTSPALRKFDGTRPAFNELENGAPWGFAVRRARPGLRGAVPGTDGKVAYFLLAELGSAAIARDGPTLTDASVTLSYVPGARLRVGQFKLPVMDEGVEANPVASDWVNFSLPAAQLVNENHVSGGRFVGGVSGYRDLGAAIFDTFQQGHLALSYMLMVSNGRRGIADDDASKDVSGRTTLAWVFSGAPSDPHRQELSVFAWGQRGERTVDGVSAQRIRSGAGVHLEKGRVRVRAEAVYASGVLVLGPSPPFEGQPLAVDMRGRAIGGYLQARARVFDGTYVGLRYEELHRQIDDTRAERVFRTLSPMLEYDPIARVRIQATYERRWMSAPNGTSDAKLIADAMGDRVAAQVTVVF